MAITAVPCASGKGFKHFMQLDGNISRDSVERDLKEIRKVLNKSGGVIISGLQVETCDVVGIQTIATFLAELERQDRPIIVEEISPAFDEYSLRMGIDLLKRYPKSRYFSGGPNELA